jgi:hypothetical protein
MRSRPRVISSPRAARVLAAFTALALVAVPLYGCGAGNTERQGSNTGFDNIKKSAGSYLNASGKELARGKTEGASVYSVNVSLDTAGNQINGNEKVLYTNRTPGVLSDVVFRVYAQDAGTGAARRPTIVTETRVNGQAATASLASSVLDVNVKDGIKPGGQAEVSFAFSEPVPPAGQDDTEGLFAYGEGTFDLGYFLPTVVTCTNGTWDRRPLADWGDANNFDCSYYSVSLTAPSGYVVAATGVEQALKGTTHVFVAGPVRDFEVQASNQYKSAERQVGSTTVTSYYYGKDSKAGALALDTGCQALALYSQHFGAYPYTRFNICEAPIEPDGAEYTGQIQMASYTYDDSYDTDDLKGTVAHEVSHQWWALGVGSDAIGNPWLDESLASYSESLYWRWVEGATSAKEALDEIADNYTSARDDDVPDAPVEQAVSSFVSEDQYTALVYGKGVFFFDELFKLLGSSAFDKALSDYYAKNVFLNATSETLLSALRASSNGSSRVDELYQRWIKQVNGDEDMAAP